MKVEIKSIKFSESLSEETNAFTANLYIDGKKRGYCRNDGRGGCTDIHGFTREDNEIIKQADQWLKENHEKVTYGSTTYDVDLEHKVDLLLENWLKEKEAKKYKNKIKKLSETALVIGKPNGTEILYYKQKKPLRTYKREGLQNWVNMIKERDCVDGKVILNENLAELGITI